jgi:hypothetical protein
MRSRPTSDDLLAHFDRPKFLICPDFEWDEAAIGPPGFERRVHATYDDDTTKSVTTDDAFVEVPRHVRDARWVLKWAAALAVFATTARVMFEFASDVSTEQALKQAAQAGLTEATLPRASRQSVAATVDRRLSAESIDPRNVNLILLENDIPITGRIHPLEGDRISVVLSASIGSTSSWFKKNGRAPLTVRTDREVPGSHLKPRTR